MRTRTLLTSVAAASIIAATAASFTPEALAQKSAVLSPRTGWAVTNVADDAGGSGAYCAMARRFTDNLILTMAKNRQSEMSFALDFPGGQFDPEKNFAVVLDPGAGQQRSYDVRPASKRAFVVRLGHDEPFLKALEKTGYLRAEVDGQTYNFNLSDIDKGQDKLDACLAGETTPKEAQAGAGGMTPLPGETGGAINKKIAGLESENRDLRSQIEAAQKAGGGPVDLGNSRHEVETLRKENIALNAQMEALKAKGQVDPQAQQKLKMLQQENEKLAAIVSASAASDGSAAGILQGLAAENQRLQAALDEKAAAFEGGAKEISASEEAMKDLTERLHILEEENLRLSQTAKEAGKSREKAGSGDEAQLKILLDQNAELQDRLNAAEMKARTGDTSGKVSALESTIERMQNKNNILNEQVSALTVALGSGSTSSSRLSDLQSKNDILSRQVEALTTALGSGGRNDGAQIDNLKRQVSDLESVNRLLQESLAGVQTSAGDDEQVEELKAANERLQASLDVEKTLKDSHKVTMGHLEARLDTLRDENKDLKGEIDKARAEALSINLALEEARDEKKALQQKADEATLSQYELAELQARLDDVKKENTTLTAELDLIRDSSKESGETHKKEIEALKKDNANIQAALDAAKDEAGAALESLRAENETLKAEVMEMASQAEDGQVQRAQIKTLISENERLAKDVAARERELQQEIVSLNDIVQNLQQENEKLNDVAIASATNGTIALKKLTEENTRLQAELAIKTKFDENTKENVATLGGQIDQLQKSNETLTLSLANLTQEADSYQTLIQEQQEEISTLKQENSDLHLQVASLQDEARTAVDMVSADQDKIAKENSLLVEENLQLKDRLKNFIHKAALEKEAAMSSLISENSRLREQLHKMSARNKVMPVSYQPPVAPRKPDVSLLRPAAAQQNEKLSQNDASGAETRSGDNLQDIAPAAGPEEPGEGGDMQMEELPEAQPEPMQEYMNEAQRAEANMKKRLEESPANPVPLVPATVHEPVAIHKPEEAVEPNIKAPKTSLSIHDILKTAGVNLTGPVELVESASKDGITAYQWQAGNLYGSAEQRQITKSADFDNFTAEYIARTKSRCPGEFAAMTDGATRQGGIRMDSYEVACIGGSVNSTATLLFFETDGFFTVVAHEADTANMDLAMEVRDRLIKAIVGTAI